MKQHKREIFTERCCLRDIAVVAASADWKTPVHRPRPTSGTIVRGPAEALDNNNVPQQSPPTNSVIRYFTVKTFHMEPRSSGDQLYMSYDPLTGIRTAAILGLFMLTVMGYILYKSRFNRKRWTSKDRLFIEVYKKKLQERRHHRPPPDIRAAVRDFMLRPADFSLMPDLTATWVKSHPVSGTDGAPCSAAASSDVQVVRTTKTSSEVVVGKSSDGRRQVRQDSEDIGCLNGTVAVQRIPSDILHRPTLQGQGSAPPRLELFASQNEIHLHGTKRHSIPSLVSRDGSLLYDTQPAVVKFTRIQPDLGNESSDLRPAV